MGGGARGQHVDGRDQADSKATGAKPSRRLAEGLAMPTAGGGAGDPGDTQESGHPGWRESPRP